MNYWLTLHYPPLPKPVPLYIYVKQKFRRSGESVCQGDRVAFYEVRGNDKGRMAVFAIGEVSGSGLEENKYPGEHPGVWPWMIRCMAHRTGGHLSYADVLRITGRRNLNIGGGLLKLTLSQFDAIASSFG